MRRLLLVLAILGFARSADAADDLSTYVANIAANPTAAAKYLDQCDMLVTPGGEVRRPCTLTLADLGGKAGMTLVAGKPKDHAIPKSPFGWREADVELREGKKVIAKLRVLEVYNASGPPDRRTAGTVFHWVKLIGDKEATAAAKARTLPAPAAIKDAIAPPPKHMTDETDISDREGGIFSMKSSLQLGDQPKETIAGWLDGGATMLGSAPNERYTGKAGGKSLRAWPVTIARTGGVSIASDHKQLIYAAFAITATAKDKTVITYTGVAIATQFMTGGGSFASSLAIVSFGVAQ